MQLGLIGIFLLIANLIICNKSPYGILYYLIFSLISPEIKLGSLSLSYNILAFYLLFLLFNKAEEHSYTKFINASNIFWSSEYNIDIIFIS